MDFPIYRTSFWPIYANGIGKLIKILPIVWENNDHNTNIGQISFTLSFVKNNIVIITSVQTDGCSPNEITKHTIITKTFNVKDDFLL